MAIWDNEDPKLEYWDEKDEQYDNKLKNEFYGDFYWYGMWFGQWVDYMSEIHHMILEDTWGFEDCIKN
jgi:hypothetical protein